MARRRASLFILLFGVLTVCVVLIMWLKQPSWEENYKYNHKGPYGASVVYALLESYFPGKSFVRLEQRLAVELPKHTSRSSCYVFIGVTPFMDSLEVHALLGFIAQGNEALIISSELPYPLVQAINPDQCFNPENTGYAFFQDTQARFNLTHPSLRLDTPVSLVYQYPTTPNKPRPLYYWEYIDDGFLCPPGGMAELGYLEPDRVNFVRIPYGKGWVYLHTTPLAFSNLALLDSVPLAYVSRVFSHLPPGDILWDNYSTVPHASSQQAGRNRKSLKASPLAYILKQPSLALAWYLVLLTAVLFLVFRTKRKQRIIPMRVPNRNGSMDFVQVVGRLNYRQANHRKAALEQVKFLNQELKDRYQVQGPPFDEPYLVALHEKTQIELTDLRKLFRLIRTVEQASEISEQTLLELHYGMERLLATKTKAP